jgi:hypothetical protein
MGILFRRIFINNFLNLKGLKFLGLPHYISAGQFDYEGAIIRYLIIPKYAISLESIRESRGTFNLNETLTLARTIFNSLTYLHDQVIFESDFFGYENNEQLIITIDYLELCAQRCEGIESDVGK